MAYAENIPYSWKAKLSGLTPRILTTEDVAVISLGNTGCGPVRPDLDL
jgi:hypothetical protein